MVFAINAPEEGEKTYQTFKEKAKVATHPNPADRTTADFTPPGSAPPAGSDVPLSSSSDPTAPTGSITGSAPVESAPVESSAGASDPASPSSGSALPSDSASAVATTAAASLDQANVAPVPSTSTTTSGALSAVRVPGAGIALTLAGLLAGMLL
jgi:hypothetical protein